MSTHIVFKAKIFSILVIIIVIVSSIFVSKDVAHAQQPTTTEQLPSDLSLDLNLAQQNPAPDKQQIIQSETKQVEIVTNTGETSTVIPQDTIAPEVKTESKDNTINPEQTTSEQVITIPAQIEIDQNGTPVPTESNPGKESVDVTGDQPTEQPTGIQPQNDVTGEPSPADNFVPGTNVTQPNDNAAPSDNSANPDLPAPTDNQPSSAPTDEQNSIPQESSPATQDNGGSSQQANPSTDTNTSGDSSVQGASTGPNPFVVFVQKILSLLTGKKK